MNTAHPNGHSDEVHEPPHESPEAGATRKERKREQKLLRKAHRPLDGWERYHALSDAVDTLRHALDIGDHKARFALVIMGALNAGLFILATRGQVVTSIPPSVRPWLATSLGLYLAVTFGFFLQAIEALRPRGADMLHDLIEVRSGPGPGEAGYEDQPLGVIIPIEILRHEFQEHRRAWASVHIGQLNAELALINHGLSHMVAAQYRALGRLYMGLKVMTFLAAALVALAAHFALAGP